MDPLELLIFTLSIRPTEMLIADIPVAVECYRESDATGTDREKGIDTVMSAALHRELTIRGLHAEALDLFSQVNAIRPVLPPEMSYTDYVEAILN